MAIPIIRELEASLRERLATLDVEGLAAHGLRRDPGGYNLVVHFLPPEVARDSAADDEIRQRLEAPVDTTCVYLHIPPCTGRCTFCHYAIEVNPAAARLDRYLDAVTLEMRTRFPRLGTVTSILVGGGTPTYLEAHELDRLLGELRSHVRLAPDFEFTCESSPETLTEQKLEVLLRHGVTRLNVGIQSFDDVLLRRLGRRHDGAGAVAAVEMARRMGFRNINIDLIYALPGQDLDAWVASLETAVALGAESITAYHLRKRPDTTISRHPSPAEDLNLLMHFGAIERLGAQGYRQSLADNFCKGGQETAQIQARDKWRDMLPVDGAGMEACSRRPDVVAFNHGTMDAYSDAALGGGGWALSHGRFLSREEQMAQRAMFALRVMDEDGGIDKAAFGAEFGEPFDALFGDVVSGLRSVGVVSDDGARVRLTTVGSLFADEVCERFYTDELRRRIRARVKVDPQGAPVAVPRGRKAADTADVVVIGGGIGGVATAASLARDLGAGVLLLEQEDQLGTDASAPGQAGYRWQFTDPVMSQLMALSMPEIEATPGTAVERTGYLYLAVTPADVSELELQARNSAAVGAPVERLAPSDAARLVPGLRTDDLMAATYGSHDGKLLPPALFAAWTRGIADAGGRISRGRRVQSLAIERGRVVGVHTDSGLISARTVVLAAGAGSQPLLRAAGVEMPLTLARRHMFVAVGPGIPPVGGPLVLSLTPPLYFRSDPLAFIASGRDLEARDVGDLERVAAVVRQRIVHRLPAMETARFFEALSRIQTYTPDGRPYVGPAPGLDGLVLCVGLGVAGIMHSPALGALAAAWVRSEASGPIAEALDPRRIALGA